MSYINKYMICDLCKANCDCQIAYSGLECKFMFLLKKQFFENLKKLMEN